MVHALRLDWEECSPSISSIQPRFLSEMLPKWTNRALSPGNSLQSIYGTRLHFLRGRQLGLGLFFRNTIMFFASLVAWHIPGACFRGRKRGYIIHTYFFVRSFRLPLCFSRCYRMLDSLMLDSLYRGYGSRFAIRLGRMCTLRYLRYSRVSFQKCCQNGQIELCLPEIHFNLCTAHDCTFYAAVNWDWDCSLEIQ
jgi:hypothetical protein